MPRKKTIPVQPTLVPFLNRELSWLEFNQRVLDEAMNMAVPLLERIKFLCITYSNLDEFFEVRVGALKQQIETDDLTRGIDGLSASQCLRSVTRRVRAMTAKAECCWSDQLRPSLAAAGISFVLPTELAESERRWLAQYYREKVHPVLTPLAIDPSHPFPQLLNKSLNLITRIRLGQGDATVERLAIVQVPRVLPATLLLPRPDSRKVHVFLSDLIGTHLDQLFPDTVIDGWWAFRITRNSELYIEEEASNLLKAVEAELHNRRKGEAVRMEISESCPESLRNELIHTLGLDLNDVYNVGALMAPGRLMSMLEDQSARELFDPPFVAPIAAAVRGWTDLFEAIREGDILLHHPYESFDTVVRFLQQAASDSRVLAIKQTLYRTGGDRRIVGALMDAVKKGKQVTAVVELKARFDEANNIAWARRLAEAGVHVVYGLVGYKIHCKVSLVVRNDPDGIRRYVHLGTGNYNASTARFYTDIGLLTCHPDFGEDASILFNLLTGVCQPRPTQRLVLAPFELHGRVQSLIRREIAHVRAGLPGRIIAKMNALVDEETILSLYEASKAGVEIDLIIRGVCCLRPGVLGLSERIRVCSIVDRFLEHSRLWFFANSNQPEVWVTSADWMPRNFFKRIEVAFPIIDGRLRDRVINEILALTLSDTVKARWLKPDGTYVMTTTVPQTTPVRSQAEFIKITRGSRHRVGNAEPQPDKGLQVRLKPVEEV